MYRLFFALLALAALCFFALGSEKTVRRTGGHPFEFRAHERIVVGETTREEVEALMKAKPAVVATDPKRGDFQVWSYAVWSGKELRFGADATERDRLLRRLKMTDMTIWDVLVYFDDAGLASEVRPLLRGPLAAAGSASQEAMASFAPAPADLAAE